MTEADNVDAPDPPPATLAGEGEKAETREWGRPLKASVAILLALCAWALVWLVQYLVRMAL